MRKLDTPGLEVYFLIVLSESGTAQATLRILTGERGRLAKIKPSMIENISVTLFMTRVDREGNMWMRRGGGHEYDLA